MTKIFCILLVLLSSASAYSQAALPDNLYSKFSPYYFGPNAFPIPEIHDGQVLKEIRLEIYNDSFFGEYNDQAFIPSVKIVFPLFSDRVNLSAWMGACDIYTLSPEKMAQLGFPEGEVPFTGVVTGDIYVSTDIQLCRQDVKSFKPDIVGRIAIKSASGGHRNMGRYYDSPGYFLDFSFAKSKYFKNSFFKELRFIASTGFICWQVSHGKQNDGIMYGARTKLKSEFFTLSADYGGYVGWRGDGDHPQSIKTSITGHIKRFDIFFLHQYGIQNYPYQQFRLGVAYQFPSRS